MYDVTKEEVFLLFVLVLAALIGYIVFSLSKSLLDGVLAGLSAFLFLIGLRFYLAETNEERLRGSFIMAFVTFTVVTKMCGLSAGIIISLSLLACCLAFILWRSEE